MLLRDQDIVHSRPGRSFQHPLSQILVMIIVPKWLDKWPIYHTKASSYSCTKYLSDAPSSLGNRRKSTADKQVSLKSGEILQE